MGKKINVVTLFSGYDSQCLALDRLKRDFPDFDYELIAWSEIDKYAIQAHNVLFPQWADRNLGDITKIDWSEVEEEIDLMTYSSPCFVAGTKVLTSIGYKNIEDLRIGDEAFTHSHTFKPISAIGSDGVKPIWEVRSMGVLPVRCTSNHPFLVRRRIRKWDNAERRWTYEFTNPYKSKVEEFVGGEYIGIPILPTLHKPAYNDEVLWLVGRYIADGHIRENELIISVGEDKLSQFNIITIPYRIHKNSDSCYRVVFSRTTPIYSAVRELTNCGKAINKMFDVKCLFFDKEDLRLILEGYMSGDGCYIQKTNSHQATTISKGLANQLVLMVQKVYGVGVKVYETKRPAKHFIQGREVNQHDTYMIRYQLSNCKKSWYNDGKFIWYPIKSVEDTKEVETIYNITVVDDHTYTANNITCFNCQDFSNAGLQKGGEEGSGTRSSLLWECKRAIVAKRPKYLLLENVKGLVSKKFLPLFGKWVSFLEDFGYYCTWQVLNAKDYGVPQNRERVFLVSIRRDLLDQSPTYSFPKPFPLEKRLKDVLEEKVDEKYYLSDKTVQAFQEHCEKKQAEGCGFKFEPTTGRGQAKSITSRSGSRETDNYIIDE